MHTQDLQRRLDQVQARSLTLLADAEAQGRTMTAAERVEADGALAEMRNLKLQLLRAKGVDGQRAEMDRMTGGAASSAGVSGGGPSLGQQFLESDTGQWLIAQRQRFPTGSWVSPSSELQAATLTGDNASGGALLIRSTCRASCRSPRVGSSWPT